MTKTDLKIKAIELRKDGYSYSEIRHEIPVAKATLSLWLKSVGLAKTQKQRLTQKKLDAAMRGAQTRRNWRLGVSKQIRSEASQELGDLDNKVFWMVGAALYWAEGSKQKEHDVSTGVVFSNSDPTMINFFYRWLQDFCKVDKDEIYFELYIHENSDVEEATRFWSQLLSVSQNNFASVRLKRNKVSYRKNKGREYHGLVRVRVRNSCNLNRKISGWAEGLCNQFLLK